MAGPGPEAAGGRPPAVTTELLVLLGLVPITGWVLGLSPAALATAVGGYLILGFVVRRAVPCSSGGLGWANRVTAARAALVCGLGGAVLQAPGSPAHQWLVAAVALAALTLDGLDGWIARRTATASAFGARFDMELDAVLILVLCLWLISAGKVGPWVLAVGGMRYGFVLAGRRWRYLTAPLPESRRRKAVCVWQVAALLLAVCPTVGPAMAVALAASALTALTLSFAVDIRWLYRQPRR